jgi:hypothetical protein
MRSARPNTRSGALVEKLRAESREIHEEEPRHGTPDELLAALNLARHLIAPPDHFSRGALARDFRYMECSPASPLAGRWDMLGAIEKVAPGLRLQLRTCLAEAIGCKQTHGLAASFCITFYGDKFGHLAALGAYGRALATLRQQVKEEKNSGK